MASWIMHMRIADEVLSKLPDLDRTGFCVGSIAPDCNVENEDWTAFTPSREVTHWMTGDKKTSADYEGFYARYLKDKTLSNEESSFYWGYMAHLMTDVSFYRFIHDEKGTAERWKRVCAAPDLLQQAEPHPLTWEHLKRVFGKKSIFAGMIAMDHAYLHACPQTAYLTVLPAIKSLPDYLDYLPKGAIVRKIAIMGGVPKETVQPDEIFFTKDEVEEYIRKTCAQIIRRIQQK